MHNYTFNITRSLVIGAIAVCFSGCGRIGVEIIQKKSNLTTDKQHDTDTDTETDTTKDTNGESGTDTEVNTGTDMEIDTNTDTEVNTDINTNTEFDTDTDTEVNTDTDTEIDTDTDTEVDTDTDTGTETEVNTDTDTEIDTGTETEIDTGTDTEIDTGTDTEIDTGTDTEIDTGTETEIDTGTDTEIDTGTDTEIDTGTDTEINTDTDTEINTDTDTEIGTDTETEVDAGTDTDVDAGVGEQPPCPSLEERLTVAEINAGTNIQYISSGYNFTPTYSGVTTDVSDNGNIYVAWKELNADTVHVTPINDKLERSASDTLITASDVSDIVAMNDGFTLLVRRVDEGARIAFDSSETPQKGFSLVRVQNSVETFTSPLTGTAGLDGARDYNNSSIIKGRLEWNGSRFGAYFTVRGGTGHSFFGEYGDKLIYIDSDGAQVAGGMSFVCRSNYGIDLIPESQVFTPFCISDGTPNPGVNLVVENEDPLLLFQEETWTGYSGGQFGGAVKWSNGTYAVAWLSRGWDSDTLSAERDDHDITLLVLDENYLPVGQPIVVAQTPTVEERNLHVAPYGENRLLLMWDSIESLSCDAGTCFGDYTSTHLGIMNWTGSMWEEESSITVDSGLAYDQKPAVAPNGDLVWSFIVTTPDYSEPLTQLVDLPNHATFKVARFSYCVD